MENPKKEINPFDPIDLSIFKEHITISFLSILDSLPANEKKTLVMERSCMKKLDFFTDFNSIKKKNVEGGIVILERMALINEEKIVIYIIPPKTECLDIIKLQVFNHQSERKDKKYYVIFIPKINYMCQKYIELNYLKSEIKVLNLNIDMFTFDNDLISLEENTALQELYIDGNMNILSVLNRVILKFETVFGTIKYKYFKGNSAKKLKELIEKEEESTKFQTNNSILAAMIFDRNVDFVTPFCTQGTYEGILDEHFDIQHNAIKIKASILDKDSKNDAKVDLSNRDPFYSKIKDYHFNKIRMYLPRKLEKHNLIFSEGRQSSELTQIQKTLEKIKKVKEVRASLTNHISIASEIGKYQTEPRIRHYTHIEQELLAGGDYTTLIEDFMNDEIGKQSDPLYILKLLCLYSVIINGLAYKTYNKIKREFLHAYGFQNLFLWTQLEKMGILKSYRSRGSYESISDGLNLINENVNILEPDDCAYAFGGYCPIIVRLIEKAVTKGWGSINKILKQLPGESEFPSNEQEVIDPLEAKNFILVVFIGGITYSEIGAIRFLNKKMKKHKFIIITTAIIHGKRLLAGLKKTFESNLTMKDFHLQLRAIE